MEFKKVLQTKVFVMKNISYYVKFKVIIFFIILEMEIIVDQLFILFSLKSTSIIFCLLLKMS
jgi:hypothetical protein